MRKGGGGQNRECAFSCEESAGPE